MDSRTDTIFERLHDLSKKKIRKKMGQLTSPRAHKSMRPRDGSTRGQWTLCTHAPFLGLYAWAMDAGPQKYLAEVSPSEIMLAL